VNAQAEQQILQAQTGDGAALNALIEEWHPAIFGYVRRYFSGRFAADVVEDLSRESTQQVWIAVHRSLGQLKDARRFKSWLYRIATNQCYEQERKWRRRKVVAVGHLMRDQDEEYATFSSHEPIDSTPRPDEALHAQDLSEQIRQALSKLPEEQRIVLMMKEYEGLKFREIAAALKVSENTVKSRLYYALKHLRKELPRWEAIRRQMHS